MFYGYFYKVCNLIESNCNCNMLICCIFASLVRSNFNFSMVTSFALYLWSNLIAIFSRLFLTLVYYHLFYLNFLKLKLNFKNKLTCFQTCFSSRDDMLRKNDTKQRRIISCIKVCLVNVLQLYGGKMCTQLWRNQQSDSFRYFINVSIFSILS